MKAVEARSGRTRAENGAPPSAAGAGGMDPGKQWRARSGIPVVPAFDGYRAVGIYGVVVFHLFQFSGILVAAGTSTWGVVTWGLLPRLPLTVLFVVSGFVIYLPVAARGGKLGPVGPFLLRRAARLLPAYWVALAAAVVVVLAVGNASDRPDLASVLAHITTLETPALLLDGDLRLGFGVIPPVWTLSVEVGFYLLVPLIALAWYRRPFVALALAVLLLVTFRELAVHAQAVADLVGVQLSPAAQERLSTTYGSQLPNWGVALGTGMTAAWLYVRLRDRIEGRVLARWAVWCTAASAAALAFFVYLAGHEAVHEPNAQAALFARQSLLVAIAYPIAVGALMLALSLAPAALQRPVANRPIRWVADISYGVYLVHFAVIFIALRELSVRADGTLWALLLWSALVVPPSLAYAYASARWLERPVRRLAHRFGQSARSDARAHAVA